MSCKKRAARLVKESTKEGKQRVKAELDKKVLIDQLRALKKHNVSRLSKNDQKNETSFNIMLLFQRISWED